MSLCINKDKPAVMVNVLVIVSLCLLITPINTAIDLSFSSLAAKQTDNYPNHTNSSAPLIDIIGPTMKDIIFQALSAFNRTNLPDELPSYKEDNNIKNITQINITKTCYDNLHNAYFGDNEERSKFFLTKLMFDSSKSKDELLTYSACMTLSYGYTEPLDDIVYLQVILDQTQDYTEINSTYYETQWSLFGVCAPIGCSDIEYSRFLHEMVHDIFNLSDGENSVYQIEVLPIRAVDYRKLEINTEFILQLLPMLIIIVFFFMVAFKCFPFCCFKSCFMNSRTARAENDVSSLQSNFALQRRNSKIYNRTGFNKFKISMSLGTHINELFGKSKYTNDTGMTYIKGIRGIAIIFSIFGFLFFTLFNNPISIYHEETFINMLRNVVFIIFFIGIRYAPRLLFSCSGFSLYYKLICFLDEKSREESQRRIERRKQKQKAKQSRKEGDKAEEDDDSDDDDDDDDEDDDEKENNKNAKDSDNVFVSSKVLSKDIKWIFLLRFYLSQIHKYIIFVLVVLTLRYSIIPMDQLLNKTSGPMWNYYKEKIVSAEGMSLAQTFTLIRQLAMRTDDFDQREIFVNYLWMISAEMMFFLVGSLIIFIGYKFKYRFNYFFSFFASLVFLCKIIYLIKNIFMSDNDKEASGNDNIFRSGGESNGNKDDFEFNIRHQTLYYFLDGFEILWNPLLNYIYFYIGTVFGAMNYVFQKKITYEMIVNSDRLYLEHAQSFLKKLADRSKKTVYCISFVSLLFVIAFSFSQFGFLLYYDSRSELELDHCTAFITSAAFNAILYFDIELVVLLVQLMAFGFNLKGNNYVNNMFSHSLWFVFEKIYFLIILFAYPVILYILSQIELRITLNMFNVLLFSFIALFYVLLFSSIFYVILELPLKKIIKVIANAHLGSQSAITQDEDNTNEEQPELINYLPIMNEDEGEDKEHEHQNDN